MQTAFVLGAGLGTRLRPLTDHLPKPLVPFGGRPLITYAFDHLIAVGIQRLIVNTHHCPEAYENAFPDSQYRSLPIQFIHEPLLLETGGGVANIRHLVPSGEDLLVYNGDILTDLPLAPALESHHTSGTPATLIIRSDHPDKRVTLTPNSNAIADIRGVLGVPLPAEHGFTGIYCLSSTFLDTLPPVENYSIIPIFIELIRSGTPVIGVLADSGSWFDLGNRDAYLAASAQHFPQPTIAPTATVDPTATITGASHIGAHASVGAHATISDSILWEAATVAAEASLHRCIVRTGKHATGQAQNQDF